MLESGAKFSPCRQYRYSLWRIWEPSKPRFVVVGLNPSTADEEKNDPTITRCIGFAKREDCGSLYMLNIFAFRATDPKVMKSTAEPIGPDNDRTLIEVAREAKIVVAAWGTHGDYRSRDFTVKKLFQDSGIDLFCLGKTKAGFPKHPLYLPGDAAIEPWSLYMPIGGRPR